MGYQDLLFCQSVNMHFPALFMEIAEKKKMWHVREIFTVALIVLNYCCILF